MCWFYIVKCDLLFPLSHMTVSSTSSGWIKNIIGILITDENNCYGRLRFTTLKQLFSAEKGVCSKLKAQWENTLTPNQESPFPLSSWLIRCGNHCHTAEEMNTRYCDDDDDEDYLSPMVDHWSLMERGHFSTYTNRNLLLVQLVKLQFATSCSKMVIRAVKWTTECSSLLQMWWYTCLPNHDQQHC